MNTRDFYTFPRYLAAKKSVDDRALNRNVWETLAANLPTSSPTEPLRILEVGAGIGTMLERMLDRNLLSYAQYTGIDALRENIAAAQLRLASRQAEVIDRSTKNAINLDRQGPGLAVTIEMEAMDLFDLFQRDKERREWDLLVAHAFLDLMDIPRTLPLLFRLLKPGGLFYFSINFDGLTLFEPAIDPAFDELVQVLYHQTMDERQMDGRTSGDSRAGRHLFTHLHGSGAQILDAGSSDWVVFPSPSGYPEDEAYFLHFIVHTLHQALAGRSELDGNRFERWIAARHAQIERCELTYIAHQLDFVGTWPRPTSSLA